MKIAIFSFCLLITFNKLSAQTYVLKSKPASGQLQIKLKVLPDKSCSFTYGLEDNTYFGDFTGNISHVADSVYHLYATMKLGQYCIKAMDDKYIYVKIDASIGNLLKSISFKYANGKTTSFFPKDGPAPTEHYIRLPYNKLWFNNNKKYNILLFQINLINNLNGQKFLVKLPFGSAIYLTAGSGCDFDLEIKNNNATTIGIPPSQTGHFILIREEEKITDSLPKAK